MIDNTIVLGFAPTRRNMYDKAFALRNKREIREKIDKLADKNIRIVDIDWLNEEGLLVDVEDVKKVKEHFIHEKVDALFMPHCNFGSEEVVGKLGREINKPFLLWGPRDETPPGVSRVRQTDTQCGLFASSKALLRYGVPFMYVENCHTDDDVFKKSFNDFIRVSSVVRSFNNMRIAQISVRPKPFLSVMVNESELLERFGIEIVPIPGVEIIEKAKGILAGKKEEIKEIIEDIKLKVDCSLMAEDAMEKVASLEIAIMETAQKNECSAVASECWYTFSKSLNAGMCFVLGDITDRGIPAACETDIHGAITSVLLSAASMGESRTFLADLTIRHPENDNAELLWHCGPFPKSLAREGSQPFIKDFKGQWELKGGDMTVARFDGCRGKYSLFAGHGRGVEGPATNGNYVWIESDDWVKWERKFIYGPYIHHVAAVHGKFVPVLQEACRYLGDVTPDFL